MFDFRGVFFARCGFEAAASIDRIGIDLRNRYILGYAPPNQVRDGRYHRVEVRLAPPRGLPKLRAHWRLGYFAPVE